jgi:hypothetical protein
VTAAFSDPMTLETTRGPITCVLATEPVTNKGTIAGRLVTCELTLRGEHETETVRFVYSHTDTAGPWSSYPSREVTKNPAPRVRQLPLPNILDMEAGV